MDVYSKADKRVADFLEWLSLRFIRIRRSIRRTTGSTAVFDELNVLYKDIERYGRSMYKAIAEEAYNDEAKQRRGLEEDFMLLILDEPNIYTTVTYTNELERRAERFAEQITAAINRSLQSEDRTNENGVKIPLESEIRKLFKKEYASMTLFIDSYMVDTVDRAREQAFKDDDVRRVRWVTRMDGRECDYCRSLNGHVFPVNRVPTKPHPHCRCYTVRFD